MSTWRMLSERFPKLQDIPQRVLNHQPPVFSEIGIRSTKLSIHLLECLLELLNRFPKRLVWKLSSFGLSVVRALCLLLHIIRIVAAHVPVIVLF